MAPKIPLLRPLRIGAGILAVTGSPSLAFNPFICCLSGPTVAEAITQVRPIPAGWRGCGFCANSSRPKQWSRR